MAEYFNLERIRLNYPHWPGTRHEFEGDDELPKVVELAEAKLKHCLQDPLLDVTIGDVLLPCDDREPKPQGVRCFLGSDGRWVDIVHHEVLLAGEPMPGPNAGDRIVIASQYTCPRDGSSGSMKSDDDNALKALDARVRALENLIKRR
jgi:hypothetical protein